ncbi:hypothetical protein ABB37_05369 [Leptomonas pyrrhocoris]|uniref:Uncharacterized protein n=1 Tax=Leptomonas pyrrhocoris TaxID=157538 RepID=A0A0M9G065_LEPPY|nr:hypothetical protein ABB37_05369 [Leptomonas pyrrhocoris]KPA79553.1 hypothetical protein ABB37_05369 [Leptomonas pyrrhocoris]|eukprot:XP_015657992.1 hypothetical protein ABB37_05369 [Leptomonas pyrrhocoris]
MTQEGRFPPTPAPPSIATGSQSRTNDEMGGITYSVANSVPLQPRQRAAAAQPPQGEMEQMRVELTTEHTTTSAGDATTDDVQFHTETTKDRHSQAELAATARPPPDAPAEKNGASEKTAGQDGHASGADAAGTAPPVPRTRGPGHTPRGARPDSARPPPRPPSRTSSRYGTPRLSHDDAGHPTAEARGRAGTPLVPETQTLRTSQPVRPSMAPSDRSIAFQVEDEMSSLASLSFKVEPAAVDRRKSEVSVDPGTLTENSDIHFSVVPESQVSRPTAGGTRPGAERSPEPNTNTEVSEIRFEVEPPRGSRAPAMTDRAATTSTTSLQFDVESTAGNTRRSSISNFSIDNDEPEPVPVRRVSQKDDDVAVTENVAAAATAPEPEPEEIMTESEERRRAKKAEEERRKKALEERSKYMNVRPWDTNAPSPRGRRTSSQAAAHGRGLQEAEKREHAAQRHKDMNTRPWRTGMATSPRRQISSERQRTPTPEPSAAGGSQRRYRRAKATPASATSSSTSSPVASSSSPRESSMQRAPREIAPPPPAEPVFDEREAAKFITPAPVLKTPLQVIGEEVEAWSETASQQRNLQAILEVMRARERDCVRLSNQQEAQEGVMRKLNKELYAIRDDYVRRNGSDVIGMPLHARRETAPEKGGAAADATAKQTELTAQDYMLLRLYPRPSHQATDYVAMKQQRDGGPTVSVLSDDDMSDGEKGDFAEDLARWRTERQALRKEKARLAHARRDLTFQMRRGSNIKDIKLTQPTSGRGPLDRRASGTETMVDVDGYDKLMDMRISAQKADVEATSAKEQYANLCMVAATMREQHDSNAREVADAQEMQEEAKERYEKALRDIRRSVEEARPLLDKAQSILKQREREAMRSDEENALSELREYSDTILAVRLQADRAAAMADAAGDDEKRMRRASTVRAGPSRTTTPRGSISGSLRPGVSPRNRANSQTYNDDVFARLTGRKSVDLQNGAPAATPKETSSAA